jgi:hypothetical protein
VKKLVFCNSIESNIVVFSPKLHTEWSRVFRCHQGGAQCLRIKNAGFNSPRRGRANTTQENELVSCLLLLFGTNGFVRVSFICIMNIHHLYCVDQREWFTIPGAS